MSAGPWRGESWIVANSEHGTGRDGWDEAVMRGARIHYTPPVKGLRVVDLFSGCGGLAFGVSDAARALGLAPSVELAADMDTGASGIYQANLSPRRTMATNIWEAIDFQVGGRGEGAHLLGSPIILAPEMEPLVGGVDLVIGGPPCQGHSTANNWTRQNDPRNILYLAMPATAIALQARALIVENVVNIRNDRSQVVQTTRGVLEHAGYRVMEGIIDCLKLGLPQTRKRHVLIAVKGDQPPLKAVADELEAGPRSVAWAIEDLLAFPRTSTFDTPAQLSETNRKRIQHLFETNAYNMPNHIRPISHQNGHTYPAVYGRLRWEEPSGTITAGFLSPGRGRFTHPSQQRALTAHEAARLQGFPDSFEFCFADGTRPNKTTLARSIGDAAPPKLGYAAALAALSALEPQSLLSPSERTAPSAARPLRSRRRA